MNIYLKLVLPIFIFLTAYQMFTNTHPLSSPFQTQTPPKISYSIAIFGDSMVDTMGEQLEYLQISLRKRYPYTIFYYYNYGIGSQNVQQGLDRFDKPFKYKTRNFKPLSELHPDIIIIGSFAYNTFTPHNKNKHWLLLRDLVQRSQSTGADVYMLAEIAPLRTGFGKGKNGVNYQPPQAFQTAQNITEQLDHAVYLARDLHIPLINVYQQTKVDGNFGSQIWIDRNDNIHPSIKGQQLVSEMIASKIKLH